MYAGVLVERATARELYERRDTLTPWVFLNSFPPMHGEHTELTGIRDPTRSRDCHGLQFPSPVSVRMNAIANETPPALEIEGSGLRFACWLHVVSPRDGPAGLSRVGTSICLAVEGGDGVSS